MQYIAVTTSMEPMLTSSARPDGTPFVLHGASSLSREAHAYALAVCRVEIRLLKDSKLMNIPIQNSLRLLRLRMFSYVSYSRLGIWRLVMSDHLLRRWA